MVDRTVVPTLLVLSILATFWQGVTECLASEPATSTGFGQNATPAAEQPIRLNERFDPLITYQVELKANLSGHLTLPATNDQPARPIQMVGSSLLKYDERVLPMDRDGAARTARIYREIQFRRTVDRREQEANIRPEVRRMVVLRSPTGKKAPFSPDGPLSWAEIDLVRTDLFIPAMVNGFLPKEPVKPGDRWTIQPDAVMELTDFDPIKDGSLSATFTTTVNLNGRRYAKILFEGTVRGIGTDGPSQNHLDGIAYFDLEAERLSYLNLRGRHELQDASGKTHGRIEGRFVMTRQAIARIPELSETALPASAAEPTVENTQLLYDNLELGIRFLYPRRWRVSRVLGQQVTLEEPQGGGILITLEPAGKLPSPEQYLGESRGYLLKQNWNITSIESPRRWTNQISRFAINAVVDQQPVRMEYAVYTDSEWGAVLAARLPGADRQELRADLDRLLKSFTLRKPIKE